MAMSSNVSHTIEWDMMDKRKFLALSAVRSLIVRSGLYPLTVIKTRLQVQPRENSYKGLADAWVKIYSTEGIGGLFRGFWINSIRVVSGVLYFLIYEGARHILGQANVSPSIRTLTAGSCASLVQQTIIVPFDILSQHLMILGITKQGIKINSQFTINPLGIPLNKSRSVWQISFDITSTIYKRDGFKGFYRGYLASLCTAVPNSALWWVFYHFYQDKLHYILHENASHLLIQSLAGTFGGLTTTFLTNPLDIVRARMQVHRTDSMAKTFQLLWAEEQTRIFTKGLSARMVQSGLYSFSTILGYETVKRISVYDNYKEHVHW